MITLSINCPVLALVGMTLDVLAELLGDLPLVAVEGINPQRRCFVLARWLRLKSLVAVGAAGDDEFALEGLLAGLVHVLVRVDAGCCACRLGSGELEIDSCPARVYVGILLNVMHAHVRDGLLEGRVGVLAN